MALTLAACGGAEPCPKNDLEPRRVALVNVGADSSFCYSSDFDLDFARPAASFVDGCEVRLDLACGLVDLAATCPGATLRCSFDLADPDTRAAAGTCSLDLVALVCQFDALMAPSAP